MPRPAYLLIIAAIALLAAEPLAVAGRDARRAGTKGIFALSKKGSIRVTHTMRRQAKTGAKLGERLVSVVSVKTRRLGGWKHVATLDAPEPGVIHMRGNGSLSDFGADLDWGDLKPGGKPYVTADGITLRAWYGRDNGSMLEVLTRTNKLVLKVGAEFGGHKVTSFLSTSRGDLRSMVLGHLGPDGAGRLTLSWLRSLNQVSRSLEKRDFSLTQ